MTTWEENYIFTDYCTWERVYSDLYNILLLQETLLSTKMDGVSYDLCNYV